MDYDIRTPELATQTLANITGIPYNIWVYKSYLSDGNIDADYLYDIIEMYNGHLPSFEDLYLIISHITTSANGCAEIAENGIGDLQSAYRNTNSELRQFLTANGIDIRIDYFCLVHNGTYYSIEYDRYDCPLDDESVEHKGWCVGRKFYSDNGLCGFFAIDAEKPYGGYVHERPEILYNIDSEKRIVDTIEISSLSKTTINEPVIRKYKRNVEQRQYEKRIEELSSHQEFNQYGKTSNHDEAIKDIRKLMNKAKKGKVYLWDPYLQADDIIDTWYYSKIYGVPLYAITSSEATIGQNVVDWIQGQKKVFESRSNNYGIKLEMRCQHGKKGYHFHDRFIMILNENEKPKVWSLGTSVNSVGKRHHIIQEVNNPQNIVDAFDALWGDIDCPECLVWKR